MFPNLRSFSLAVAMAALVTAPGGAQPANPSDEQRCTGQAGVRPDAQAAACTALIDSGRFTRQNLAILHSNRGNANGNGGDYDRAISDFGNAIRLEPRNVAIVMSRATAYEAKGDFGRAIADYDQALKLDPNFTPAMNSRGNAWRSNGNIDRAIADFDQMIRLNPKDVAAYNNRAMALTERRDFD